jgi:hypothetical protein
LEKKVDRVNYHLSICALRSSVDHVTRNSWTLLTSRTKSSATCSNFRRRYHVQTPYMLYQEDGWRTLAIGGSFILVDILVHHKCR